MKDKYILVIGSLIFLFAVFSLFSSIILMQEKKEYNNIIFKNRVVTTEVCKEWAQRNETEKQKPFFYQDEYNIKHIISSKVGMEVCQKWEKVKNQVDKNENKQN